MRARSRLRSVPVEVARERGSRGYMKEEIGIPGIL